MNVSDLEKPSQARIALKWGLITALVVVVLKSIMYSLEMYTSGLLSGLILAAQVGGLVMAMREFRGANGGYMRYGEGLGLGLLMFAVIGLIDATFQQIYQTYIDPDFTEKVFDESAAMLEKIGLDDERIDEARDRAIEQSSSPFSFIGSVFGSLLYGLVLSLITAAIMRRNRENPFD